MALKFQTVNVSANSQDSSPATVTGKTDSFGGPIVSFEAALSGYDLTYNNDDHHLRRVITSVDDASLDPADPTRVDVTVTLGIGDEGADDNWSGSASILVIADVAQS